MATPASAITPPAIVIARRQARGSRHCEPTWNDTPSRAACGRVARSNVTASAASAPNFPDRSSTAPQFGNASRTTSPSVPATPVACVSARIFASSSVLSSTKSRTPCLAQASRIAPRAFAGCMKWIFASANICRTNATSLAEAQSKCRTPPFHSARSTAGSALHFTAYSTSPGKAATNSVAVADSVVGRMQCTGSSGRSSAISASTERGVDARALATSGRRRRRGETAERTRRLDIATILATVRGRAERTRHGDHGRRSDRPHSDAPRALRRQTQAMRGLRFASNRSANIGSSLTTPAHAMTGSTEKDAYVVAVPSRARGT